MRHTAAEIRVLLPLLDEDIAETLESESLDFKECPNEERLRELVLKSAICFANAKGGTVVFGVRERVVGRARAIIGIDFAPDLQRIKGHLYDTTEPKLTVEFEWLDFEQKRLLLMHISSSRPPYTTTSGRGWVRIGRDCQPLTGSLLKSVSEGAGLTDQTGKLLPISAPLDALSPAAIEILRREMASAHAPPELLAYDDHEFCTRLGIIRDDRVTLGGLLVAGREDVLADLAPYHEWKYSRMRSDTEYDTVPVSGHECILVALDKIMLLLNQQNPITTVPSGFFHAEFPQYPIIALREALLNAFAHRDYAIPSMVLIRHWRAGIEINSPGGFVGGITPQNILHHAPVTRNRYLVETILLATRLVNRHNLGVPRMFDALLREGKEPPIFEDAGDTVCVTFPGQEVDAPFKALLTILDRERQAYLDTDTLLLLHFFRRRHEARLNEIHEVYPYNDRLLREKLAYLENDLFMIEHSGTGQGIMYRLSRRAAAILDRRTAYDLNRRLDKEAIKVRILTILKDRPLSNKEIRAFTDLDRTQVTALMKELEEEGQTRVSGRGAGASWYRKEMN